jgi:hypothetical protein
MAMIGEEDEKNTTFASPPLPAHPFTRCASFSGLRFTRHAEGRLGTPRVIWQATDTSIVGTYHAALSPDVTISANEHVLQALQLNKDNQAAVKTQIEQLENKLAALDKLLVCAVSQIHA